MNNKTDYDVVIIGGSLAGSSTAYLLKKKNPQLKILVCEKTSEFKRRVGESTVEISSLFLRKTLDLNEHLTEEHVLKQGLRFWFYEKSDSEVLNCSELGPKYNAKVPTFQIDRARLDQFQLDKISSMGVEVKKETQVIDLEISEGKTQKVTLKINGDDRTLNCRWVVDATGVRSFTPRKFGWFQTNKDHPISSIWSRWKGCFNLNELGKEDSKFFSRGPVLRGTATAHLMGKGWWAWVIPLKCGDTSIGVVFDERIVDYKQFQGKNLGENFRSFLEEHPLGKKILKEASFVEKDLNFRRNIAYQSKVLMKNGLAVVGDAAGMLDPFYSPGLDWLAHTVTSSVKIIEEGLEGNRIDKDIKNHNLVFNRSYKRWFKGLYQDKYYYLGEYDLMKKGYLLDFFLYYFGVVTKPYSKCLSHLEHPPFGHQKDLFGHLFIKCYHRALSFIAKRRMKRNEWGKMNEGRFYLFEGPSFGGFPTTKVIPLYTKIMLQTFGNMIRK